MNFNKKTLLVLGYENFVFARYEKYTKTAKLSTNIEINILNVQKSSLYRNLVAWLKTQPIWNE